MITKTLTTAGYRSRIERNQALQKEWVKQQTREHDWSKQNDKREEKDWAEQSENITRMRGMLEDEMDQKKKAQLKEMQEYN